MKPKKTPTNDPETMLQALEQLTQSLEAMQHVMRRLRGNLSAQEGTAEPEQPQAPAIPEPKTADLPEPTVLVSDTPIVLH